MRDFDVARPEKAFIRSQICKKNVEVFDVSRRRGPCRRATTDAESPKAA